jgi:protein phosphatase
VICSDGLTDEIDDETIARLTSHSASSVEAANVLVDAALTAGGRDNITAIVVRVTEVGDEPATASTATVPRKLSWTGDR